MNQVRIQGTSLEQLTLLETQNRRSQGSKNNEGNHRDYCQNGGTMYPVDLRVVTQAEIEKFKKETGINGYSQSQREKH